MRYLSLIRPGIHLILSGPEIYVINTNMNPVSLIKVKDVIPEEMPKLVAHADKMDKIIEEVVKEARTKGLI